MKQTDLKRIEVDDLFFVENSEEYLICYAISDKYAFFCPVEYRPDGTIIKQVEFTTVYSRNLTDGTTPIKEIVDCSRVNKEVINV